MSRMTLCCISSFTCVARMCIFYDCFVSVQKQIRNASRFRRGSVVNRRLHIYMTPCIPDFGSTILFAQVGGLFELFRRVTPRYPPPLSL